jgi:hypothetical protein
LSDWYLPAKDELNQLNLEKTTVGLSVRDIYWSSSEVNGVNAWAQSSDGSQGMVFKGDDTSFVRPIRAFAPLTPISVAAIAGVTAPVTGATPVSTTTSGTGYTGTVTWSGSPSTFAGATIYTATITLTPTSGYTLTGVNANFFTVTGTTSVSHSADSGEITAVFPATTKATQTITFATPSAMTVGGSTQTVSPTASSSLTVTLTSTTTSICTVAGFVITAVGAGTCSISASQAGNANYEAASDVIRTFALTAVINIAAIAGVTAPVSGATPVSTTTAGTGYTGTVSWSGSPSTFTEGTIYTATITLTPTSGYTLTGVSANFFTVAGATSVSHDANSGVIRAAFPAAPRQISPGSISLRRPATGETPNTVVSGPGYTGTVSWSGSPSTFASATSYTARITLAATSGYTLSGISENFFTVPAAYSATNAANSGVITVIYSATASTISVAAIAGVTAPLTGATPVSTTTAGTGYTGTVSWSGSPATFAPGTSYTATITLTVPIAFELDYTLTGVIANFFTVAGATTVTHSANSGVIRAVFPATAKTTQTITFTDPSDITYGQSPSSLSATSTSSLTVAFTTATSGICSVSGTTLTILAAGTCTINANQAGDASYEAATQVVQSFTIAKATQSITFATPSAMTVGGSTQTVSPTASSSLTVTLTSTTTGICTVAGFVITAVTPGTCSITASQAGNAYYEAATQVVETFGLTAIINIAEIAGVTAPVAGATPVSTTTAGTGYTGTVSWASSAGALSGNFAGGTIYAARITLTPTSGYTLTGVSANFFTVAGATSVSHDANSGVITAVFPGVIDIGISGLNYPVAEGIPVTTVTPNAQYTGTVSWSGSPSTFAPTTIYTATITLTPKSGYTLAGVNANFFTIAGATSASNDANSGVITAVFPATGVLSARAVAITTQPTGAASGSALGTQPVIRIVDSSGTTVTSNVNVVASIASGIGTLSGTTTVAASNGIATFTDLVVTGTAGTFTLTFTATSLSAATSNSLTITAGPASKVAITRSSAGTQRNTAFTTQPQITIQDASGNTVTSSTAVVTAQVTSGFNPRLTIGSNTATAVSGVATFSDLGIDGYGKVRSANGYRITYSADGLASATESIALTGLACDGKSFTCRLGDTGPGGGTVFYVASGTFTQNGATGSMCSSNCKYLEFAPSDVLWDYGYSWSGPTNNAYSFIGATDIVIGTGYLNTQRIIAGTDFDGVLRSAVLTAKNYRGPNDLSDWFIPSANEIFQFWTWNIYFDFVRIGADAGTYWSSSEHDFQMGWYLSFYNEFSSVATALKGTSRYIRPVRAFGP